MTSLAGFRNGRILTINSPNIKLCQREPSNIKVKNKEIHDLVSGMMQPGF